MVVVCAEYIRPINSARCHTTSFRLQISKVGQLLQVVEFNLAHEHPVVFRDIGASRDGIVHQPLGVLLQPKVRFVGVKVKDSHWTGGTTGMKARRLLPFQMLCLICRLTRRPWAVFAKT